MKGFILNIVFITTRIHQSEHRSQQRSLPRNSKKAAMMVSLILFCSHFVATVHKVKFVLIVEYNSLDFMVLMTLNGITTTKINTIFLIFY